jgi:hypothetical protein
VLGAIRTSCSDSTWQIGSTPNRSRVRIDTADDQRNRRSSSAWAKKRRRGLEDVVPSAQLGVLTLELFDAGLAELGTPGRRPASIEPPRAL